jgi:starvation-inducible outer membrane lipoprotein
MYDIILSEYLGCDDIEQLENMNIDYFYTEIIQKKYKCWLAADQYIIQKEGYSDITKGNKWGDGFDWSTFSVKYIPK